MILDNIARFQADIMQDETVEIKGFWRRIALENPGEEPLIGSLEQRLSASYQSLEEADQAALGFSDFPALAAQFETAPFTTIAALLWKLRQAQEEAAANFLATAFLPADLPPGLP